MDGPIGIHEGVVLVTEKNGKKQTLRPMTLKEKVERPDLPWDRIAGRLRAAFGDHGLAETDGMRFSRNEEWLHVRPSGTEPVVRFIAESPSEQRSRALIEEARRALRPE